MKDIFESVKLMARLAVFAGVSALVASLSESVTRLPQDSVTVILGFVLAGLDKWVHVNKDIKMNGLTPF